MRLIIITQDRLSDWGEKGEVVEGYFNPGNAFDEIDIILLNDDVPSTNLASTLCGDATCNIYNLPLLTYGVLLKTLAWRSFLLEGQYNKLTALLKRDEPTVIRAYETSLASYSAYVISKKLDCNYAISLHSTPDNVALRAFSTPKDKIVRWVTAGLGIKGRKEASKIMAVYNSIIESLPAELKGKCFLIPNAVGVKEADRKQGYSSNSALKLVTTGRLIQGKSPEKIIEAVCASEDVELTVIGDGPLREELMQLVERLGAKQQVTFVKRMNNPDLCTDLKKFDGFIFRTDYNECPKTVIEAALVGLPIICPNTLQQRVFELQDLPILTCEDSASGFAEAINSLNNEDTRQKLGSEIGEKAYKKWAPENCAANSADLLIKLIK